MYKPYIHHLSTAFPKPWDLVLAKRGSPGVPVEFWGLEARRPWKSTARMAPFPVFFEQFL